MSSKIRNIKATSESLTWERIKTRFNEEIIYKTSVLNHGDHFSILTQMVVKGEIKHSDLNHIPIELLDLIKNLNQCENT